MNLKEAFLKTLADNEDDTVARLVYADYLDEQGEHEEADRQRKWPAAKEWLARFCRESSNYLELPYEEVLGFGRQAVGDANPTARVHLDSRAMWDALKAHASEFWKNWSIVTGIALPATLENKDFHHWQCCPNENYYWFGPPDSSEPAEESEQVDASEAESEPPAEAESHE